MSESLLFFRELWARLGGGLRLAAALGTAATLSSCGGDNGPSSYALNVYVSGLTGSGLQVTLNGGTPIGISGNSQTTLARLTNGAAYVVAINAQPNNPAQTCSAANLSGKISGNNVDVMINCVLAVQTSTVVALDQAVPAGLSAEIVKVVSPTTSGSLNASLALPFASPTNDNMVLALNAKDQILLASMVTQYQTTLSADSTALALVRIAIGVLDPSTTPPATVNASIRATMEYPHLSEVVDAALAAGVAPSSANDVIASISLVVTQLVTSTAATAALQGTSHRSIKALGPKFIPASPYTLLNYSGANTEFQTVQLEGVTGTGDAIVSDRTSIAWSLFASDPQSGQAICGSVCETVILPPNIFQTAGALFSGTPIGYITSNVPATNTAYNLTLQQSGLSISANVIQITSDLESTIIAGAIGTAVEAQAPAAAQQALKVKACVVGVVQSAISSSAVVAALGDRSGPSIESYVQATLKNVFGPGGVSAIGTCLGALAPITPDADFAEALTQVTFGLASYVLTKSPVTAAAGLGFEVGQTLYYLGPNFVPVTFGVCLGTPPKGAFGIVDCAKSFTFNPTTLYMAPTATGSAPTITAIGLVTATTLVPTDVKYDVAPDRISIDPTTNTITATASPSSTPAVVTATSSSTSATGSYQVFVVDPILTPSALAVDTTSSAQTVTVTLFGPNENPILLPTGITWSAQLIKDSDSSSTPIIPSIAGGVATFTIPIQTAPGRLDVSAGTDPAGTSYGFESISVTSSPVGQTFTYQGLPLTCEAPGCQAQAPGPVTANVTLSSPVSANYSGTVCYDGGPSCDTVVTISSFSLSSNGIGSYAGSLADRFAPAYTVVFTNGKITQWQLASVGATTFDGDTYAGIFTNGGLGAVFVPGSAVCIDLAPIDTIVHVLGITCQFTGPYGAGGGGGTWSQP